MGARWRDVCPRHLDSGEEAHQSGRARQGIKPVASLVETQSFQGVQSPLSRTFLLAGCWLVRSVRALDLLFLRLIPHLMDVETLGTPSIEGWKHVIRLGYTGFICAGVDGLNRYIKDPWLASTNNAIPGP